MILLKIWIEQVFDKNYCPEFHNKINTFVSPNFMNCFQTQSKMKSNKACHSIRLHTRIVLQFKILKLNSLNCEVVVESENNVEIKAKVLIFISAFAFFFSTEIYTIMQMGKHWLSLKAAVMQTTNPGAT